MAKVRYNAKKIAKTPALKKKLAIIVAQYDEEVRKVTMLDVLVYGHRGLISYSEDELCKKFDKIFNHHLEIRNDLHAKLKEIEPVSRRRWDQETIQGSIKQNEEHIAKLQEVANEIFEDRFL